MKYRFTNGRHAQIDEHGICHGCFFTPEEDPEAVKNAKWIDGKAHHVAHPVGCGFLRGAISDGSGTTDIDA